uniref:Interferon-induced GTP-binding protein Mx2 n=1 Tax=Homo sapiens TaxID=9606 RepID=UPI00053CEE51|nr:Chain A, Interferon-induced GTP-binding protein Mx2 [Homo sapiens]4X0R_B Chain B, Interferon-induced GTP-binding protein Mx2 [Homo sapiens]
SQEADKMFFLIEKIKMFNQDIEKLVEGEEVVRENETRLYNKIREDFKNWVGILATNTQKVKNIIHEEVEKYEKQAAAAELLGFVNYKTFEIIVHQYIQQLVEPALSMLQKAMEIIQQAFINVAKKHFGEFFNLNQTVQSTIEDIKVKHTAKAENMIQLQFRMEQMVFKLNSHFPSNESSVSSFTEIGIHLNAYFLETSKRLANQIPFIIQYFMLRENGDSLQKAMMQILQEKNRYSWLL